MANGPEADTDEGLALIGTASDLKTKHGWTGLFQVLVGAVAFSLFTGVNAIWQALTFLISYPLEQLGFDIATLQSAITRGPGEFIMGAFAAGASAFGSGWTGVLGPFQPIIAVGVVAVVLWEVAYYLDYVDTDLFGPIVANLPLIGSDDSGVAGED